MNLNNLKKDLPYKFKVQTAQQYGAVMVAYVDSRIVQDLLDDVVGPENWQDKYTAGVNCAYCSIGIKCGDEWVWKGDCGTAGNIEKEKSQASDAFKRAAVKWGVARFLYSLPITKLKTVTYKDKKDNQGRLKYYPCDNNSNILWDREAITAFCRGLSSGKPPVKPAKVPPKKPAPAKLPSMNEHEIAAMKNVWAMTKGLKPEAKQEKIFKQMIMSHLYKTMGHWPTTQGEQEEAINILDKEFNVK
jgi:hypothetical protein